MTIHAVFNFKFGNNSDSLSDQKLAEYRQSFSQLKLLIIDEMSLLNADMLYKIHLRLTEIKQNKDLFGGIGIILVGDLLQLPPVKGRYIFEQPMNTHFSAFHDVSPLWKSFNPFVLEHNHRQGECKAWAETLNRIREGILHPEDLESLQQRLTQDPFLDEDSMHVFYTHREVHEHNSKMLAKLVTQEQIHSAIHVLPKGYYPRTTPHGTVASTQFQEELKLKVGARCMLIFNVNTIDELVNGATGTILAFERAKRFVKNVNDCIIIKFDDETCGREQRLKYPALSNKYKESNGTPIFRQELEYQISSQTGKGHAARAKVIQFPLRISYASTAHKMQVKY